MSEFTLDAYLDMPDDGTYPSRNMSISPLSHARTFQTTCRRSSTVPS